MTAQEVVERIIALRKLTQETGCITRRTQSELLASLSSETLMTVAVELKKIKETEKDDRYSQK